MTVIISASIHTPCGPVSISYPVNVPDIPLPDFSFFLNFPPKFYIPWPNCNFIRHLNSAPEPAADSLPPATASNST